MSGFYDILLRRCAQDGEELVQLGLGVVVVTAGKLKVPYLDAREVEVSSASSYAW